MRLTQELAYDTSDTIAGASPAHRAKVARSLALIHEALQRAANPYVAFSGGKDSIVTLALVETIVPDVKVIWSDDELELPETVHYMEILQTLDTNNQFTITLGWAEHAGWFRPWHELPYWREPLPGAIRIDMPVEIWAADLGHELTFTGLRMAENRRRRNWLVQNRGLYPWKRGWRCCPIWDWTADDVWHFLAARRIPYNPAYDVMTVAGIDRNRQRVGPLPLTPRDIMSDCWPDLLERLEERYGQKWR